MPSLLLGGQGVLHSSQQSAVVLEDGKKFALCRHADTPAPHGCVPLYVVCLRVSRLHCTIAQQDDGAWAIEDGAWGSSSMSVNGVQINGDARLTATHVLCDGDAITIAGSGLSITYSSKSRTVAHALAASSQAAAEGMASGDDDDGDDSSEEDDRPLNQRGPSAPPAPGDGDAGDQWRAKKKPTKKPAAAASGGAARKEPSTSKRFLSFRRPDGMLLGEVGLPFNPASKVDKLRQAMQRTLPGTLAQMFPGGFHFVLAGSRAPLHEEQEKHCKAERLLTEDGCSFYVQPSFTHDPLNAPPPAWAGAQPQAEPLTPCGAANPPAPTTDGEISTTPITGSGDRGAAFPPPVPPPMPPPMPIAERGRVGGGGSRKRKASLPNDGNKPPTAYNVFRADRTAQLLIERPELDSKKRRQEVVSQDWKGADVKGDFYHERRRNLEAEARSKIDEWKRSHAANQPSAAADDDADDADDADADAPEPADLGDGSAAPMAEADDDFQPPTFRQEPLDSQCFGISGIDD